MIKKKLSIIVPAHNEEKNIPIIYEEIFKLFEKIKSKYDYEVIFINDGSNDDSWQEIKLLHKKNNTVKGLSFSRNFGHQAAIEAGLKNSTGDAIVMIDCDGQHPVKLISSLIEKWEKGAYIVNTIREDTKNVSWFKKASAHLFYKFINIFSETKIHPGTADFRMLDRKVVDILNNLPEHDKFYRGLVNWVGYKSVYVRYVANSRVHGQSSYSFAKMLNLARVGITSFSLLPLKIIISLGMLITISSAIMLAVMFYYRWLIDVHYFSSMAFLAVIIVFSNGIILLVIGIVAIYLLTIYKEIQNRPNYIVKERVNL